MIVNLGSIDVSPETCRQIRKATFGISGRATRVEVRDYCIATIMEDLALLDALSNEGTDIPDEEEEEDVEVAPVSPPVLSVVTLPSREALYA